MSGNYLGIRTEGSKEGSGKRKTMDETYPQQHVEQLPVMIQLWESWTTRHLTETVSIWHAPKLLLLLFHHPSISLSPFYFTVIFRQNHGVLLLSHSTFLDATHKKFIFHLIQKDYFLGHLKTHTNKINEPQNSLQSLAGCKTSSPRHLLCVQQRGRVQWPEPHQVDSVPGSKVKSWWRRKLAPQNS